MSNGRRKHCLVEIFKTMSRLLLAVQHTAIEYWWQPYHLCPQHLAPFSGIYKISLYLKKGSLDTYDTYLGRELGAVMGPCDGTVCGNSRPQLEACSFATQGVTATGKPISSALCSQHHVTEPGLRHPGEKTPLNRTCFSIRRRYNGNSHCFHLHQQTNRSKGKERTKDFTPLKWR